MIVSSKININGDLYNAINCRIEVSGAYRYGLRTLTFKENVVNNYKATVSVEILKHEANLLISDLSKVARAAGYGFTHADVPFNLSARFQPKPIGKAPGLSAVEILGAMIMEREEGIQTGGEAVVTKMDLLVIRPIRKTINGKVVVMVEDPIDGFGSDLVPIGVVFGVKP